MCFKLLIIQAIFCLILFLFPGKINKISQQHRKQLPTCQQAQKKTRYNFSICHRFLFFHGHALKTFTDRGYTSNALVNRKQSDFLLCYRCIFRLICLSFLSVRRCHPSLGLQHLFLKLLLTPKAMITAVTKMVYPRRRSQPHQVFSDLIQSLHLKSETKRKKSKYLKKENKVAFLVRYHLKDQ